MDSDLFLRLLSLPLRRPVFSFWHEQRYRSALPRAQLSILNMVPSAGGGDASLLARLHFGLGRGRQMKHGRVLAVHQMSKQDQLSVGELYGVVVHVGLLAIDLAEDRGLVLELLGLDVVAVEKHADWRRESKLGARQNANGSGRVFRRRETAGACAEVGSAQLVADGGRSRLHVGDAVVAHGCAPLREKKRGVTGQLRHVNAHPTLIVPRKTPANG